MASAHLVSSDFLDSLLMCLQAGRGSSGSNAAPGQHPAGSAAPAAAVRAESLRRPGGGAAAPGSAAAQVPHHRLQVGTVNTAGQGRT